MNICLLAFNFFGIFKTGFLFFFFLCLFFELYIFSASLLALKGRGVAEVHVVLMYIFGYFGTH